MSNANAITIVIPIHNEAAFLPSVLPQIRAELDAVTRSYRLLLIENGSTDATLEVAEHHASDDARIEVHSLAEPDYGAAMRYGFMKASDDEWVVNFDIDYFSGGFITHALASNADLVIASKRAPGSEDRRSLLRRLATRTFNILLRVVLSSGVSDTHGIKAFRRNVRNSVLDDVRRTQDMFDTELVIRAERAGFTIEEVPIVVEELREARSSLLKRVPRTVKAIVQLRLELSRERLNTTSR